MNLLISTFCLAVVAALTLMRLPVYIAAPAIAAGVVFAGWSMVGYRADSSSYATEQALERSRTVLMALPDEGPRA